MASLSRRIRFLLVGAIVVVCATAWLLSWQFAIAPALTRRLSLALGHEVQVGSWSMGLGALFQAREIRIMGVPPFETEPVATIETMRVRMRGAQGIFSPSKVEIEGLAIAFLGTLQKNNLFATKPNRAPVANSDRRSALGLPTVHVLSGRISGVLLVRKGLQVAFRSGEFNLERNPAGEVRARLEKVTADLQDGISFRVPTLALDIDKSRQITFRGDQGALQIPRGGDLVSGLSLIGVRANGGLNMEIQTVEATSGKVSGTLRVEKETRSLVAEVQVKDLPLLPLEALLKKKVLGLSRARGSIEGSISTDLSSLVSTINLGLSVSDFDLQHPAWDRTPWEGITASATLRGLVDLPARTLTLQRSELGLLGLDLELSSHINLSAPAKGDVRLTTRTGIPNSCAKVLNAQPAPFKEIFKGLSVTGNLAFQLSAAMDTSAWDQTQLELKMPSLCTVKSEPDLLARLLPILFQPNQEPPPGTRMPLGKFHPDYTTLARLPPYIPNAFITAEDSKFFRHNGFDLDMMRLALSQDLQSRSFSRGASTITQQLAKNLFLSHQRTLARKLEEAIFAWRIHRLLGKDRILELYLNIIELGPGIQGIHQAAKIYFGKDPTELTPLEAAHLAALTPNPHVLARRFRDGQVDEGWRQRLIDLLSMMKRMGRLSAEEVTKARASGLTLRPLEQTARHHP